MKHTDSERAAVHAALSRIQAQLSEQQVDALLDHLALVIEKNKVLNLTRITDFDEAVKLHIEDSLSILPEFEKTQGRFIDIGTGGGFPGLPLAIATGRQGVLMDSVKKKAHAVQEFVDALDMGDQLSTCDLRSEELAQKEPESFDVVVMRAVASLAVVEELAAPLLRFNGFLIALKGSVSTEEEKSSQIASSKVGFQLVSKRIFKIGDGSYDRSVFVYQKISAPEVKLPRRPGMAVKKPLG